jgi:hypothetical protein
MDYLIIIIQVQYAEMAAGVAAAAAEQLLYS